MKKSGIFELETIAYISALNGVEIKKIEYGINDYVYCISGSWGSHKTVHKVKIRYGNRPSIRIHNYTLYLDEAIRT